MFSIDGNAMTVLFLHKLPQRQHKLAYCIIRFIPAQLGKLFMGEIIIIHNIMRTAREFNVLSPE